MTRRWVRTASERVEDPSWTGSRSRAALVAYVSLGTLSWLWFLVRSFDVRTPTPHASRWAVVWGGATAFTFAVGGGLAFATPEESAVSVLVWVLRAGSLAHVYLANRSRLERLARAEVATENALIAAAMPRGYGFPEVRDPGLPNAGNDAVGQLGQTGRLGQLGYPGQPGQPGQPGYPGEPGQAGLPGRFPAPERDPFVPPYLDDGLPVPDEPWQARPAPPVGVGGAADDDGRTRRRRASLGSVDVGTAVPSSARDGDPGPVPPAVQAGRVLELPPDPVDPGRRGWRRSRRLPPPPARQLPGRRLDL